MSLKSPLHFQQPGPDESRIEDHQNAAIPNSKYLGGISLGWSLGSL